jgi:hypothetical protein
MLDAMSAQWDLYQRQVRDHHAREKAMLN